MPASPRPRFALALAFVAAVAVSSIGAIRGAHLPLPEASAPSDALAHTPANHAATDQGHGRDLRYDQAVFAATHNSYSGGPRGSLEMQLDSGMRFLELDIHDNGFEANGDFRVGHYFPGQGVEHTGNPATLLLTDWLDVIARWSAAHPDASPITVLLDAKDDFSANSGVATGNLFALNAHVERAFAGRLLRPDDVGATWPQVRELQGRVIVVLSGDEDARVAYRQTIARTASAALDARDRVLVTHASSCGDMWLWSGTLGTDGVVRWREHARYGRGRAPLVALHASGLIVEVHAALLGPSAYYRIGELGEDLTVQWGEELPLGTGVPQSLTWVTTPTSPWPLATPALARIHVQLRDGNSPPRTLSASTARGAASLTWLVVDEAPPATDARGRWLEVEVEPDTHVLLYSTDAAPATKPMPIRPPQAMFVEVQPSARRALYDDEGLRFFAASGPDGIEPRWRRDGAVLRLWRFTEREMQQPAVNFPAVDTPQAAWYRHYLTRATRRDALPALAQQSRAEPPRASSL